MKKNRTVTLSIPEDVACRIETVTRREVSDVALELVIQFFSDERRTQIPVKSIAIRFPVDWYDRMLKLWGQRKISAIIRDLIYVKITTGKNDPLTPPPEWRESHKKMPAATATAIEGTSDCIKQLVVPQDWFDRLRETYGNNVSTWIKSLVYLELMKTPGRKPLSFPRQLNKFVFG